MRMAGLFVLEYLAGAQTFPHFKHRHLVGKFGQEKTFFHVRCCRRPPPIIAGLYRKGFHEWRENGSQQR